MNKTAGWAAAAMGAGGKLLGIGGGQKPVTPPSPGQPPSSGLHGLTGSFLGAGGQAIRKAMPAAPMQAAGFGNISGKPAQQGSPAFNQEVQNSLGAGMKNPLAQSMMKTPAPPLGPTGEAKQKKSAAWSLGYLFSYRFPKAEAFQKVAKALNTNEHALRFIFAKQAFAPMQKNAIGPLGIGLGLGALGLFGRPLVNVGTNMLNRSLGGYGMLGGPNPGMFGGLDPNAQSEFTRMALREAARNQQLRNNMQLLNYASTGYPMGSPMAGMHALGMPGVGY